MAGQKGRSFLLKVEASDSPASYTTISGNRALSMRINNSLVDITDKDSAGIQELLADGGVQSLSIQTAGRFKDAADEETLRAAAFDRTQLNYQLAFPNGDTYEAAFLVQDYERSGPHDDAEDYSCTLVRAAAGSYTAA